MTPRVGLEVKRCQKAQDTARFHATMGTSNSSPTTNEPPEMHMKTGPPGPPRPALGRPRTVFTETGSRGALLGTSERVALERGFFSSLSFLAPFQSYTWACTSLASPWSQSRVLSVSKSLGETLTCPLASVLPGARRPRMVLGPLCAVRQGGEAPGPLQGHYRGTCPIQKEKDLL